MEKDYGQICYGAGCNNYATTVVKIPFGSRIHLVVPGTGSE